MINLRNDIDRVFIAGGAGFIGSHVVDVMLKGGMKVLNYDNLTYAANTGHVRRLLECNQYQFVKGDINDFTFLDATISSFQPNYIVNLAAETHVDRSISDPSIFPNVNVIGTFNLLELARKYLPENHGLFIQVGTDEVYGSRLPNLPANEEAALMPSNVYAATKASADLMAISYFKTFALPVIVTRCCNNYGSRQHDEKFIPKILNKLLNSEQIPIYGTGEQVRQWIHVEDHAAAILCLLKQGKRGKIYNISDRHYFKNIELVETICRIFDQLNGNGFDSRHLIQSVSDRLGHDFSYSITSELIKHDTDWEPKIRWTDGLLNLIKDKLKSI